MSGFVVGSIVAKLEMDVSGWKQSIQAVENDQRSLAGAIQRHEAGITKLGQAFTIAGAAMVGSLTAVVMSTTKLGDEYDDLRQRTGIAVNTISSFRLAIGKTDLGMAGFANSMKFLGKNMVAATQAGSQAEGKFQALGVTFKNTDGTLRPLDQVMLDVADKFKAMPDGAEKATIAMQLFGRAGTGMIHMLNLGKEGLQGEIDKAKELGIVWTNESAAAADEFQESLVTLKGATEGLGQAIMIAVLPAFQSIVEGITQVVAKIQSWIREAPGLTSVLSTMVLGIGGFLSVLGPTLILLPKLTAGMTALKAATGLSVGAMSGAILVFSAAAGAVFTLAGKYKELADAEDRLKKSTDALREPQDSLVEKLSAAATAADWQYGRMAKLIEKYSSKGDGYLAALAVAIEKGKEGADIQKALADVSEKHAKKIDELQKATKGFNFDQKALNETLGLTLKIDLEKKYADMLTALTLYKGKLTEQGEKKMIEDLIALRAELDGTVPFVTNLEDTMATFDETIAGLMDDADVQRVNDGFAKIADDGQLEFNRLTEGIVKSVLEIEPTVGLLEFKFKLLGDAMGVSADTIRLALWNIQAEFLRTMGIMVPLFERLPEAAGKTTKTIGDYFSGLYNDIASGFGNTIQKWLSGATTFRDFMSGLWGNIKDSFFRMVGEMIAKWVVDFIGGLISSAISTAATVGSSLASIGTAISTVVGTVGTVLVSFVTTIGTMIVTLATAIASAMVALATGIAGAATIIAAAAPAIIVTSLLALGIVAGLNLLKRIFASGGGGSGDGMGRVVERQDVQTMWLTRIFEDITNNIKPTLWSISEKISQLLSAIGTKGIFGYLKSYFPKTDKIISTLGGISGYMKTANSLLNGILIAIKGLPTAQHGAVATQNQLMMIHGTPNDPEYIFRKSQLTDISIPDASINQGTSVPSFTMTIPIMLDGSRIDERMVRISNGRVEWLHSQYQRANRTIPNKAISGV